MSIKTKDVKTNIYGLLEPALTSFWGQCAPLFPMSCAATSWWGLGVAMVGIFILGNWQMLLIRVCLPERQFTSSTAYYLNPGKTAWQGHTGLTNPAWLQRRWHGAVGCVYWDRRSRCRSRIRKKILHNFPVPRSPSSPNLIQNRKLRSLPQIMSR